MEKPCERCGTVTMTDEDHRICYDCFCELDELDRLEQHIIDQDYLKLIKVEEE